MTGRRAWQTPAVAALPRSSVSAAVLAGAALVVAVGVTACREHRPPGSQPQHMDRLAAAFATASLECNPRSAFEALVEPEDPRDAERVEAGYRAFFRLLLADEHVVVDSVAFSRCLTFLEGDGRCDGFGGAGEGDCDRIFLGTLSGGQRCALREECESEVCAFGGASPCGTCADDSVGQRGEFCGVRACAEGLFCQYERPGGAVCEPLRGDDEPCFAEQDGARLFFRCEEGLACADDDVCRGEALEGEACGGDRRCALGLSCDDGLCAPPLVGVDVGDACDPGGAACGETLKTGLACEGPEGAASCVVAAVVTEGEVCDGGNSRDDVTASRWCRHALTTHRCQRLADEAEGTCRPRPDVGDDCRLRQCHAGTSGCVTEGGGNSALCRRWPEVGESCLVVDGRPTCGPELSCQTGGGTSVCAPFPFPTSLPQCG